MQDLIFFVQGSQDEPYKIRIVRSDEGELSAYCTCEAASNGMHCKHRIGILTGKPENLLESKENRESLLTVAEWVKGSAIESVLIQLNAAEDEFKAIKSKISRLKKMLARAMVE